MNPVRMVPVDSPDPAKQVKYDLFCHDYRVRVIVTSTLSVAREWIALTRRYRGSKLRKGRLVVGIGVQPDRRGGAATIHLCVAKHCLIFQLAHAAQSPATLSRLLSDPRVTFVGFGNLGVGVAEMLAQSHHNLHVDRLMDLPRLASTLKFTPIDATMETLALLILGWDDVVEEAVGQIDWEIQRLSVEQVKYASLDAFISYLIGRDLRAFLYATL